MFNNIRYLLIVGSIAGCHCQTAEAQSALATQRFLLCTQSPVVDMMPCTRRSSSDLDSAGSIHCLIPVGLIKEQTWTISVNTGHPDWLQPLTIHTDPPLSSRKPHTLTRDPVLDRLLHHSLSSLRFKSVLTLCQLLFSCFWEPLPVPVSTPKIPFPRGCSFHRFSEAAVSVQHEKAKLL